MHGQGTLARMRTSVHPAPSLSARLMFTLVPKESSYHVPCGTPPIIRAAPPGPGAVHSSPGRPLQAMRRCAAYQTCRHIISTFQKVSRTNHMHEIRRLSPEYFFPQPGTLGREICRERRSKRIAQCYRINGRKPSRRANNLLRENAASSPSAGMTHVIRSHSSLRIFSPSPRLPFTRS
ncbi:hypothetical protein VTK26DRAFT_4968 [Humicola hyalothermophila]